MAKIRQFLQKIVVAIHIVSIIFLVIAAALFSDGYKRYNSEQKSEDPVCFLYNKLSGSEPKTGKDSYCILSIASEALSVLGLLPLVILGIVKLVRGFVG